MTKNFYTAAIVNVVGYFSQVDPAKIAVLPTKMRWYIKKNLGKMLPIAKQFEDFRGEIVGEFQKKWFDEEHSDEGMQDKVDKDGNPVKDEMGNVVTEAMRKIKPEYIKDYEAAATEINKKLNEILLEKVDVEITPINLDGFVESMDDDCPITMEDLDILSAFEEA